MFSAWGSNVLLDRLYITRHIDGLQPIMIMLFTFPLWICLPLVDLFNLVLNKPTYLFAQHTGYDLRASRYEFVSHMFTVYLN